MLKKLMHSPEVQQMMSRQRSMQQPQPMPVGGGKAGIVDMVNRNRNAAQMPAGNPLQFQPRQAPVGAGKASMPMQQPGGLGTGNGVRSKAQSLAQALVARK